MTKIKGLEVDRRVGIAVSVLPPDQQQLVEKVIRSQRSFAKAAQMPGRVHQMMNTGEPLYNLRVSPTLRLIYTIIGETAYVVDVVENATLLHFAQQKANTKTVKTQIAKKSPKTVVKKLHAGV